MYHHTCISQDWIHASPEAITESNSHFTFNKKVGEILSERRLLQMSFDFATAAAAGLRVPLPYLDRDCSGGVQPICLYLAHFTV